MHQRMLLSLILLAFCACSRKPTPVALPAPEPATAQAGAQALPADATPVHALITRDQFNQAAAEENLPLFWRDDLNHNQNMETNELAVLWHRDWPEERVWREGLAFSTKFEQTYAQLVRGVQASQNAPVALPSQELRKDAVLKELRQGRPTLVRSDLTQVSPEEKQMVQHVLRAAELVEVLFAQQSGTAAMYKAIPRSDAASRALFVRNQAPWCEAPATENDPNCNALTDLPKKRSGLYPTDIQANPEFCTAIAKDPTAVDVVTAFGMVVRGDKGELKNVPYSRAWPAEMDAVAKELTAAASALGASKEPALKVYLLAAAGAFVDDDWVKADEAWAKMSATNSKWYLRIAPDETYHEPCARKAGFHVSFARINPAALKWQQLLEPVKGDLEKALAELAGPPYVSGKIAFHLPDFIDIVINAGDSRSALGATIGQSLPNWGPVANESRGRTVAMTNLYNDADSKAVVRTQVESLYCTSAMPLFSDDSEPQVMSTVLHEAAHNLGPAHEYKVDGKVDDDIFGGPLAATLEELKAQTAALYFTDWLADKKLIDDKKRHEAHSADIAWNFGHISQGMFNPAGKPKPYSHLAAIQVGVLLDGGGLQWNKAETAANGRDAGCFAFNLPKLAPAIKGLMAQVAHIKGAGDKPAAEALVEKYTKKIGDFADLRRVIRERWLRAPKAAFVYAVEL